MPINRPWAAILLFGLLFSSCGENGRQETAELEEIVKKVNAKCPTLLDSETEFNGIDLVNEKTIRYKYTLINASAAAIDTHAFRAAMWPGILSTIRVSEEMKKLREQQLHVEYFYQDKYKVPVYTFKIRPSDYK
jgi:hypothetical protein